LDLAHAMNMLEICTSFGFRRVEAYHFSGLLSYNWADSTIIFRGQVNVNLAVMESSERIF
jgi:hypothetical protein